MDEINERIAAIYGGVLRHGLDRFHDFAMAQLNAAVAFDSAFWASGEDKTWTIHSIHVTNQKLEDLLAISMQHGDEETLRPAAMASPGVAICIEDTMTLEAYRQLALYRETGRRIGIEYAMAVGIVDAISGLVNMVVVYRKDRTRPFSPADREAMAVLVPHLLEAWRHCQFHALRQPEQTSPEITDTYLQGRAVTDQFGAITQADPSFGAAVALTYPGWSGALLPRELVAFIQSEQMIFYRDAIRFSIVRGAQLHVVSALGAVRGSKLGVAELDVARRVAAGESHVRIAAARGVSSATVRNQIARIYEKLGVHSKVELIRKLSSLRMS